MHQTLKVDNEHGPHFVGVNYGTVLVVPKTVRSRYKRVHWVLKHWVKLATSAQTSPAYMVGVKRPDHIDGSNARGHAWHRPDGCAPEGHRVCCEIVSVPVRLWGCFLRIAQRPPHERRLQTRGRPCQQKDPAHVFD